MNRNVTFPAVSITGLNLRLAWASAEILADRTEDVQILVAGDARDVSELRIQQEKNQLTIEQPNYGLSMKLNSERWLEIFIRVPRSWKGSIQGGSISGKLTARGLIGTDLSLESTSGDIRTTNTSFMTTSVKTVSGNIELSAPECEQLTLRTVSGNVAVSSGNALKLQLSAVSGDSVIKLVNVPEQVEGNTVSGQVVLQAPIEAADASLRSVSGRMLTENVSIREGATRVAFASVSGHLILHSTR